MNWRDEKSCPSCHEPTSFEGKLLSNPTIEIYRCVGCDKRFEFDTWTKSAKEIDATATVAGRRLQL